MIDLKNYPLRYFRKSDGVLFYVKRASGSDYVLIHSETFEKFFKTQHMLRKEYESDTTANKEYIKSIFNETA